MNKIKNNEALYKDVFSIKYYIIVLMVICNFVAYVITEYSGIVNSENEALVGALMNFFGYLTILPILFVNRHVIKKAYSDILKSNVIKFLFVILLGYIVLTIFNAISTNIISSIVSNSNANQEGLDSSVDGGLIAIIVMVPTMIILGPVVEELIFRKAVFNVIKNEKVAIAVSLIGFGFIHIIQPLIYGDFGSLIYIFQYALMGSVLVYIYLKHDKNIGYSISLHMLNNSITALALVIAFINK